MKSYGEWMARFNKFGTYSMAIINKKAPKFLILQQQEETKSRNRRHKNDRDNKEE